MKDLKNKNIKRIIFDIDNTLIRGVSFYDSMKKTLEECNIKKSVEEFEKAIDNYEKYYSSYNIEDFKSHISNKLKVKLNNSFMSIYFKNLKEVVPTDNEEIKSTLEYLSNKYELVLLSNFFERVQRDRLKKMKINNYFMEYYGEKITKPNKEAYLSAANLYSPSECLIIGDNDYLDIDAPASLGFNVLKITDEKENNSINKISDLKNIL